MNKKILLAIIYTLSCFAIHAQLPFANTFSVKVKTDNGNDTIVCIDKLEYNNLTFIGGNGKVVYNQPDTNSESQTHNEENIDVYAWLNSFDSKKANITINSTDASWNLHFGICISKKSNISFTSIEDMIQIPYNDKMGYIDEKGTFIYNLSQQDLSQVNILLLDKIAKISSDKKISTIEFCGLDYITKYYIKPFVILNNYDGKDMIMFGGEKSFETQKTIDAALKNEKEVCNYCYHDSSSHIVLTQKAIDKIYQETIKDVVVNENAAINCITENLKVFVSSDKIDVLKEHINKRIKCTDGTLLLVDDIPENLIVGFKDFVLGPIKFDPSQYINYDVDSKGNPEYTKNTINPRIIECQESLGVPNNRYIDIIPASASVNPYIGINIPIVPFPNMQYDIYVTLVNPDNETDPRGYRFYTNIIEQEVEGEYAGKFVGNGERLANPDGSGNYFVYDGTKFADEVYLGKYTFRGSQTILQLQSQVPSKLTAEYNRNMRISQITLIPTKE